MSDNAKSRSFKKGDPLLYVEALPGGKIKVHDDVVYEGRTTSKDWHHIRFKNGKVISVQRREFTNQVK